MTPNELAADLGYSGKTIRQWLRDYRPRDESLKWSRWGDLSSEDEMAVRRAFVRRRTEQGSEPLP